jgi:hypothetical protein
VRSLWLKGKGVAELFEQTAEELTWTQQRNAQAKKSHAKATKRRLRQLGIMLTQIPRCNWSTTQ